MSDIIQLLPDSVANQIAAGEVIQRPASVIKELVENAVDAGADEIQVVVKDAGRTLIQVMDNGIGMSDTDARLSFERHATSKIRNANDLFEIRTKGFRGEALASIAAIAQVTLRTRQSDEELGTEISINGSELEYQRGVSCPTGTIFTVKNLFFNVPARRKFLKSNSTELRHIINEFQHIVLSHPEIGFSLNHNDSDLYRLPAGNLRQRIIHVFGKQINTNLNNLKSETSIVNLTGFIGKPENARKTSGEQYFFVNRRYMRHPYFHRAVMKAFERLISEDTYPSYFIYFDADPHSIDVNIHPTKTEIKFENEQAIFQIIQAAVREALGKSSVVPSIDFETEGVVDIPVLRKDSSFQAPEIPTNPDYNPFDAGPSPGGYPRKKEVLYDWEKLYNDPGPTRTETPEEEQRLFTEEEVNTQKAAEFIQLGKRYIITPVKSGLMIVDQKLAFERILFEQFIFSIAHNRGIAQRELYPSKLDLEPSDYLMLLEIKDELAMLGIDIGDLGTNTVVINSCPAGIESTDLRELVESLLEEYKQTEQKVGGSAIKNVAASLARAASAGSLRILQHSEMQQLIDELFACENPNYSCDGKKITTILKQGELEQYLK
ncbi:MAG: DNA mismatch repair endonuclease MutL [Bacteroidales bacterium]|nr:DNA mismatch repair endonuclease MutL [Bacteroidales bacterium]